jgi:hypothetical protein
MSPVVHTFWNSQSNSDFEVYNSTYSVIDPVVTYDQGSTPWNDDLTYSPNGDNLCGVYPNVHTCTIAEVGCVITSFAMLTQTWRDNLNIAYDPGYINTTVKNAGISTYSFSPTSFASVFPTILKYESGYSRTVEYSTAADVFLVVKSAIDNNMLIIVGGRNYAYTPAKTHFAAIYGYTASFVIKSLGSVTHEYVAINVNDPAFSYTTLDQFMGVYEKVHRIYTFSKVN